MISKEFYTAFGNLLYALAMSDGAVQEVEKNSILKLVKEKLVPLENAKDNMGSDLANYAAFAFETADEQIENVEDALSVFVDYVKEHHENISREQLQVLNAIIKEVAKAYGRVTQKEQEIIDTFNGMMYSF
jgi:iron-sulfur cluster repair protein YtfE (RIC family)